MPPVLLRSIRAVERTLRFRAAANGIADLAFWLVFILAADYTLDRFFEFSRNSRVVILLALAVLSAFLIWKHFVSRVFAKFRQEQLAMLLEHFVPKLNESLITSIEAPLSAQCSGEDIHQSLMSRTKAQAAGSLQRINHRKFFRSGRLFFRCGFAGLIIGVAAGVCSSFAESAELWFSRNFLLSNREYPRRSWVIADGFENGRVRIGRGDSFTLTIRACCSMPLVPDNIRLRVGTSESGSRILLISQFHVDNIGGTDWRVFSHTFSEMLETLTLQVRGADSTLDNLTVEVVPPPVLSNYQLTLTSPEYMKRENRTLTPGLRTPLPEGSSFTLTADSNKPLLKTETVVNKTTLVAIQPESVPFDKISYQLENVREDTTLEFHLEDIDRLRNRQPLRLDFNVVKDNLPAITARLDNIGSAVTPNAVLPVLGEITDDYGLGSVVFRYTIQKPEKKDEAKKDETTPEQPAEVKADVTNVNGTVDVSISENTGLFSLNESFLLEKLQVAPDDKLSLYLEAADLYNLPTKDGKETEPRISRGQQWNVEVVTPERLRGLLEVREIGFRQRFEVIIGEVEKTASLINEIALEPTEEQVKQADELKPASTSNSDNENRTLSAEESERIKTELEEKKRIVLQTIPPEQATAGAYNISRSLRDTQKESYDIRALTESFRSLRAEMVNNRIFTDEVQKRLDDGIIAPMQDAVVKDFAEINEVLNSLNGTLNIRNQPLREIAQKQKADVLEKFITLITKLQNIRDKMVSMENYNEAVELLRAIIKQQQQLRQETEEEKNKRLRNLLE
ncbi:MAG: hypothetical protein FWE67_06905 [Planctomycetaceae bacterium]|nr:hypothetical protein [Planctomycetaceae bacterium]